MQFFLIVSINKGKLQMNMYSYVDTKMAVTENQKVKNGTLKLSKIAKQLGISEKVHKECFL